ncbi:hypothetical protein [Rahnella sp. EDr1-12]|uniref:hypothetical protein n=1 Tax=unclassified Rahnella TaxID=2635087 RepID=UPI003BAD2426
MNVEFEAGISQINRQDLPRRKTGATLAGGHAQAAYESPYLSEKSGFSPVQPVGIVFIYIS